MKIISRFFTILGLLAAFSAHSENCATVLNGWHWSFVYSDTVGSGGPACFGTGTMYTYTSSGIQYASLTMIPDSYSCPNRSTVSSYAPINTGLDAAGRCQILGTEYPYIKMPIVGGTEKISFSGTHWPNGSTNCTNASHHGDRIGCIYSFGSSDGLWASNNSQDWGEIWFYQRY